MKKTISALLLVCICGGTPLQAADWSKAEFDEVEDAAEEGDVEALYTLGMMYVHGDKDAEWDHVQAADWLRKAAEKGHVAAQRELGKMYAKDGLDYSATSVYAEHIAEENIEDLEQDYKEAVYWYRKAAAQGDAQATMSLIYIYQQNKLPPDDDALEWMEQAAEEGWGQAQEYLMRIYTENKLELNYDQAMELMEQSKKQGWAATKKSIEKILNEIAKEDTSPTADIQGGQELPFVGKRSFNFAGGSGTAEFVTIQSNGHTVVESCGASLPDDNGDFQEPICSVNWKGPFSNPLKTDGGLYRIEKERIYQIETDGSPARDCIASSEDCSVELYVAE